MTWTIALLFLAGFVIGLNAIFALKVFRRVWRRKRLLRLQQLRCGTCRGIGSVYIPFTATNGLGYPIETSGGTWTVCPECKGASLFKIA